MPLNKSRGNMYEWVDFTWNPVKGCEFDCSYCYIKANKRYSLKPRYFNKEMETDLGRGNTIFVGSMCDMFGPWVPSEWIENVLRKCRTVAYNSNKYLFQSKNPMRFHNFLNKFPVNTILGTTIETSIGRLISSKAPSVFERAYAMRFIKQFKKEVTIEPIMDFDRPWLVQLIRDCHPDFVSIGADSKGHNLTEPKAWKIMRLIQELDSFTSVKPKKNLKRIINLIRVGGDGQKEA